MPAFAASSRNSRLDIMAPPNWRPGARDRSGSDKDHPERSALNDVVERVVIEVDRMNSDMKLLHRRRDQSEHETRNSPANRAIWPATICRQQREEQEECARQIGDDPDVELARNEENDERKENELREGEAANEDRLSLFELKNGADVPCGEAGHENRQDCGRPENPPARARGSEEETVHGSAQNRRRADRGEEHDEPEAQLLVARAKAGERNHKNCALDGQRIVGKGNGGFCHAFTLLVSHAGHSTHLYVVNASDCGLPPPPSFDVLSGHPV